MNRVKFLLVIVMYLGVWGSCYGQENAPDAQFKTGKISSSNEIVANVNSKVDMYTGKASILIPLHEVQADGLSIPITLSYQTGGIKVTDVSGLVGLGWNFSFGGRITRSLSGPHSDRYIGGGYMWGQEPGNAWATWDKLIKTIKDKDATRQEYWAYTILRKDGRPDMFFYEVPGSSGMFMLGSGPTLYTIPRQNLKIEYVDPSGLMDSFKITDENGYEYYLGHIYENGKLVDSSAQEQSIWWNNRHATTWYLKKIMKDGKEIVTYTYETGTSYSYDSWDKVHTLKYEGTSLKETKSEYTYGLMVDIYLPKYLKSIKTENEELIFSYSNTRRDFNNMRLLTKIDVKYNNETAKSILLDYGEFGNKAPKLQSVKEQKKNLAVETICSFDYEEAVNIPD